MRPDVPSKRRQSVGHVKTLVGRYAVKSQGANTSKPRRVIPLNQPISSLEKNDLIPDTGRYVMEARI
jgi:hypothetical protein